MYAPIGVTLKLSRQFLANIAVAAFVVGLFLAYSGLIVTFYGIRGKTDIDLLGRTFESANVGVALIALGAALIVLNIHRISKRFVVALSVGPATNALAKIGSAQLAQMLERENLQRPKNQLLEKGKSETARSAPQEKEQVTTADEVGESSLAAGHDASHGSEEQIQTKLPPPEEMVTLTPDEVPRNSPPLKMLSSVPGPGPFVGREAELGRLQVLFEGGRNHLIVLIGSDGIGKSALAATAVHQFVEDLSQVFWHRFSEDDHPCLDMLFLKFQTFFQVQGDKSLSGLLESRETTIEDKVNAVATALSKQNYSLIFDDLHLLLDGSHRILDPGLQHLFTRFLQGGYPGSVVLVSRIEPVFEGQLLGSEGIVELETLGQEASHELLTSLGNPSESPDRLGKVYELTQGNPQEMLLLAGLADSQALDSLGEAGSRGEDFQDRLLELVARELEAAEQKLLLVAITHRGPITEEVFGHHIGASSEGMLETLQRLVKRSVLSYDGKNRTYRLPGLLKQYLVDTLEEKAQVKAHLEAARYYDGFPFPEEPASYDQALGQVQASYHYFRAGQPSEAAPFRLSKHFLRWGLDELHLEMWRRVRDRLEGKDLATFYNQMGLIYRAQRDYDEALDYFLETERIGKEAHDRPTLGATYDNIGEIYRIRGVHDKALDYYLKSEKIREEVGDRAGLGAIYNNIGLLKYSQGAYEEAQRYLERSYEILSQLDAHAEAEQVRENLELLVAQQLRRPRIIQEEASAIPQALLSESSSFRHC